MQSISRGVHYADGKYSLMQFFEQVAAPLLVPAVEQVLVGRLGGALLVAPRRQALLRQRLPRPALEGVLEGGVLQEVAARGADVGDFVIEGLTRGEAEGALGDVLRVGLLGAQLDFPLELRLELRVGAPQEVVFQLQVLQGLPVLADLLAQRLQLPDELLELVVVEVVELVHLQLDYLAPQLAVLLEHLLQPALPGMRRERQVAQFAAGLRGVQPVGGLLVLAVGIGRHGLGRGLVLLLMPVRPSLLASHSGIIISWNAAQKVQRAQSVRANCRGRSKRLLYKMGRSVEMAGWSFEIICGKKLIKAVNKKFHSSIIVNHNIAAN